MTSPIQTGVLEPITVFIVNALGDPLAGLTDIVVRVRRRSDGRFLDWDSYPATSFEAAPVAIDSPILTEVDAANAPGLYELAGGLDTSQIGNLVADDHYLVYPVQTIGSSAKLPAPEEFRVGHWADKIRDVVTASSTG